MGLRTSGSGQLQGALRQIIEAERQPIRNLENRKKIEQAKLQLFQEFKGRFAGIREALAEVSGFGKFRELKADLGDGSNLMSVTLDKERAQPGSYNIEIIELAERSSMISNTFESPDEPNLGMGYVIVEDENGDDFEIFVDEPDASLRGIARLINEHPRSPVRASVVKDATDDEEPWRLIVSAKKGGDAASVDFPEFYFLGGEADIWIDNEEDAQNGLIAIDGYEIETAGNQVADFLQGVNAQFKQAAEGRPFTLTITEDTKKVSGKVKNVIDKVNEILKFINDQNAINETTDTRATFAGDTSLQNIQYRLRNVLHEGFPAGLNTENFRYVFLHQLGVEFGKDGLLKFDENKFKTGLEKDFDGVSESISGPYGFAAQVGHVFQNYTRPIDGLLELRERGLRARIGEIDRNIESKERRLEQKTQALTQKFARLETALAQMQQQQQYMSATLGSSGGGLEALIGGA